jgi:hypothetical protein
MVYMGIYVVKFLDDANCLFMGGLKDHMGFVT